MFSGDGVAAIVELYLPCHRCVGGIVVVILMTVDMFVRRPQLHCYNRVPNLQVQVKFREETSSWAGVGVSQDLARSCQSTTVVQEETAFALNWAPEEE